MKSASALFLVLTLPFTSSSATIPSRNQDIVAATEEMQRAGYFTFVTLLNMAPPDLFQGNVTFLVPKDQTLSKTNLAETSLVNFLLSQSIPSPLLFDHFEHFPTGSMIPTSRPGFMLKVTNDGRQRFFLNDVRIISPNICTIVSSVRCHGIDGVIQPTILPQPDIPPPFSCLNGTVVPSPPPPGSPPAGEVSPVPGTAREPAPAPKSSSSKACDVTGVVNLSMRLVIMSMVQMWISRC